MIKYRTESFSGLGERDAVPVCVFETFELGNTDILETLRNGILKGHPVTDRYQKVIDSLDKIGYVPDMSPAEQTALYEDVIRAVNSVTGLNIKYVLWLADIETVRDYYGQYMLSDDDYDSYETGPVVLSNCGYDGCLYGYEKYPEPIKRD